MVEMVSVVVAGRELLSVVVFEPEARVLNEFANGIDCEEPAVVDQDAFILDVTLLPSRLDELLVLAKGEEEEPNPVP